MGRTGQTRKSHWMKMERVAKATVCKKVQSLESTIRKKKGFAIQVVVQV